VARHPAPPGTGPEPGAGAGPEYLVVGHVTRPHGIRGEVYVTPLTDRPELVFAPGRRMRLGDSEAALDPAEPPKEVAGVRPFKRGLLVKFDDVRDRTAAEAMAGRYLLVPLAELEPLEEGEYYYHQLLGLEVVTRDGERVGCVREVYETAPAHLLEVTGEGKPHLIPFTARIVRQVDLEARRIVIEPPPGLLEL